MANAGVAASFGTFLDVRRLGSIVCTVLLVRVASERSHDLARF